MKIDAYAHVLPPRYRERVLDLLTEHSGSQSEAFVRMLRKDESLTDLDARLRIMDTIGGDYRQVLTTALTSAEFVDVAVNLQLAEVANDELAGLVASHPHRFRGWVAQVALLDVDAGLRELERAFAQGALGAQINTHIAGRPLDDPAFAPFFQFMAAHRRPIWVHPNRGIAQSEYPAEDSSRFTLYSKTGWPTDTTNAMLRLVYSGTLDRWPGLRILTHHAGGTIPMIAGRLVEPPPERIDLEPLPRLKRLYADTAAFGNTIAVRAALEFFGEDHVLFGTDFGFSSSFAQRSVASIEDGVADLAVREKIYSSNFEAFVERSS